MAWNESRISAVLFMEKWFERQAASRSSAELEVPTHPPLSPETFAARQELLESIGFLPSSFSASHNSFHAFTDLLRTPEWKGLRQHVPGTRSDTRTLPCFKVVAGWQCFEQLAVFNRWGVERTREGSFVPGDCLLRLEKATIACVTMLPSNVRINKLVHELAYFMDYINYFDRVLIFYLNYLLDL